MLCLSDWLCGKMIMEIRLNLISPEKKEDIAKKNKITATIRIEIFLTVILAVFLGMLLIFNYILKINFDSVMIAEKKNENSGKYDKIRELDKNFSQANKGFSDVISIKNSQLYWSKFFLKINELVFPGVKIESISTSDYSIIISGISDTRDNLILFKDKLAGEKCFSNVNLPLADLVGKSDIVFQIDLSIDKNCLKNQ